MPTKTYIRDDQEYYLDTDEPVWSHRYRQMRDGIKGKPAYDLKDEPGIIQILEALEELERETWPGLGLDPKGKDAAAFKALHLAAWLVDNVAGWAIDHQRGLAQEGLRFLGTVADTVKASSEHSERLAAVDVHDHERDGASRGPLSPIQSRKFLLNMLVPMGDRLSLPDDIVEALEALDYGETLPIFAKASTSRRTGLIEYRAKLSAIAFIEYEHEKGTLKHRSTDTVMEAFAVTRDAAKDWKADLQVALGPYEVRRDNQDGNPATIRMRMRRCWGDEGRA